MRIYFIDGPLKDQESLWRGGFRMLVPFYEERKTWSGGDSVERVIRYHVYEFDDLDERRIVNYMRYAGVL